MNGVKRQTIRRLAVAQGPIQLIGALMAMRHRAGLPEHADAAMDDTLIVGDIFTAPAVCRRIEAVCREMARLYGFEHVAHSQPVDRVFHRGEISLPLYLAMIRDIAGHDHFDEVYVCRNMQPLNEAVLRIYPQALKVCYGDGLGTIDVNERHYYSPLEGEEFVQPDLYACLMPYEKTPGVLEGKPLQMIPAARFHEAVFTAFLGVRGLALACRDISAAARGRPLALVCLANLTESMDTADVEHETAFYLEGCLPHLEPGMRVLVKGHPRETLDQSGRLVRLLRGRGLDAHALDSHKHVPVELFAIGLPLARVVSLISSAAAGCRLLRPGADVVVGVPRATNAAHIVTAYDLMFFVRQYVRLVRMAESLEFTPIRAAEAGDPAVAADSPVLLPGLAGDRLEHWLDALAGQMARADGLAGLLARVAEETPGNALWPELLRRLPGRGETR